MHAGFTIAQPETLDEALELLGGGDDTVRPIGGGSGLTLLMKYGFFEPTCLVSLRRVAGLTGVSVTEDGGLRIGASTTLRDLELSPLVAERSPALLETLARLATVRLRNVAQVAGAIAHGHPQMDLPPMLLALDARIRLESHRGSRWIDADDVFRGYYETAIADDELITEIVLPPLGRHRGTYRKVTARTVDDWPMLGLAVVTRTDGGSTRTLVAVSAVTDRALRLTVAEDALRGVSRTSDDLRQIAADAAASLEYHDSPYGSAAYQQQILSVELYRALQTTLRDGDATPEGR